MKLKGQASMIDILLLGLFISIVLVGGSVFIGQEELRAQNGREEAVYAQAQLITAMNYRLADWQNRTAAEMIAAKFCDRSIRTVGNTSCSLDDAFYNEMRNMTDGTGRTGYNYIFWAEAQENVSGNVTTVGSFTVCNHQPTVCAKHVPAIATTIIPVRCPNGEAMAITYLNGMWPSWQELPLACD